jgi:hypothetical protein
MSVKVRVLCIMNLTSGAKSESLILSQGAETSKRKCQERKTSAVEKYHHDNVPAHALLLIHDFSLGNKKKSAGAR